MKKTIPEAYSFPFDYRIVRSRRKTLFIYVKSGKVEVRSPLQAPQEWVKAFLHERSAWVCRQIEEQRRKLEERLVIAEGQEVGFLGLPRRVEVVLSARPKVEMREDRLFLFTRENAPAQLEKIFHRWLLERAREYMTPRTITFARQLGVEEKLKEVVFRKTRSKWGHCCHDGTIQYNWLAMMAPREVVDYLIIHECSHLLHMNHSKAFWKVVAGLCPAYRERRDWLKRNGHRLWTD